MRDAPNAAAEAAHLWLKDRLNLYAAEFIPPPEPRGSKANVVWTRLWLEWCLHHWPVEFMFHAPAMVELGEHWMIGELIDETEQFLGADR